MKRGTDTHIDKRLVLNDDVYFGVGLFFWYLTALYELQRLCGVGANMRFSSAKVVVMRFMRWEH